MTSRNLSIILLGLMWTCAVARAADGPQLTLTANDAMETAHSRARPLLLQVSASSRGSANARMQNIQTRRLMQVYSRSAEYAKMSEEERRKLYERHPIVEERRSTISADAVRIIVRDAQGRELDRSARPLAVTASVRDAEVSAAASQPLYYGIDASELSRWPEGVYTLQAAAGSQVSAPVTVRLSVQDPPADERYKIKDRPSYLTGTYHVLDRNWTEALKAADELIARDAASVEGWTIKGDALVGQNSIEPALEAYHTALKAANARPKQPGDEGPRYIARRIAELTERSKG